LKLGMSISFDLNIFGNKYFAVFFYEWDTFDTCFSFYKHMKVQILLLSHEQIS